MMVIRGNTGRFNKGSLCREVSMRKEILGVVFGGIEKTG